ncbi:MAG: hypothetical protein QM484_08920 [Woeseiaceae bacterium]
MHDLNLQQLKHHGAIGGVALYGTHLENTLQSVLWRVAGLNSTIGRCITQHMSFGIIETAILTIFNESPKLSEHNSSAKVLLKRCDNLRLKRNDIVHSYWGIFLGSDAPSSLDASKGEVTGMVIKARGSLKIKINKTTVSEIDDIIEEILLLNKELAEFAAEHLPALIK